VTQPVKPPTVSALPFKAQPVRKRSKLPALSIAYPSACGIDIGAASHFVAGERDGATLARLRDRRIKAEEAEIAAALQGNWRDEHLCLPSNRPWPTQTRHTGQELGAL
jgi:hypothetical protein